VVQLGYSNDNEVKRCGKKEEKVASEEGEIRARHLMYIDLLEILQCQPYR
jgi:hypothetical protein